MIDLLTLISSLSAILFGTLSVIIGWVGSRLIMKQDTMLDKMDDIKYDLHNKLNQLDIRLTKIEILSNTDESRFA
jgi:hypothetical protein